MERATVVRADATAHAPARFRRRDEVTARRFRPGIESERRRHGPSPLPPKDLHGFDQAVADLLERPELADSVVLIASASFNWVPE